MEYLPDFCSSVDVMMFVHRALRKWEMWEFLLQTSLIRSVVEAATSMQLDGDFEVCQALG